MNGYDEKCGDLARYFLGPNKQQVAELAQELQEVIEDFCKAHACPVCGNEERDHRDLLTCECPSPTTIDARRRIAKEMTEAEAK